MVDRQSLIDFLSFKVSNIASSALTILLFNVLTDLTEHNKGTIKQYVVFVIKYAKKHTNCTIIMNCYNASDHSI